VATLEQALMTLLGPSFDPKREVLLRHGDERPPTPGFVGTSRLVSRRADRLVIEAELSAPGYAVILERWHAGWRATVDGEPAEVLRANELFRAVALPAGRHRVELAYRPPALLWGLAVSTLSLMLGAAAWVGGRRRGASSDRR
jgi:hypothetical protein